MDTSLNISPEELQRMLEKAKADWQAQLEKLTPEERERALQRAQQAVDEDAAARQALLDSAARIAAQTAPAEKPLPKFCPNCGTPVRGGKFCANCGHRF